MKFAHVQTWYGSKSIEVVDMTHAGRRGKRCDTLRTWCHCLPDDVGDRLINMITPELIAQGYDAICAAIEEAVASWAHGYNIERGLIRGVDAPVEKLVHCVAGKWSASADNDGIHLEDLSDTNNMPRTITAHGQSQSEAYRLAARVWPAVVRATSLHEAREILTAAGCRLHSYCAMD